MKFFPLILWVTQFGFSVLFPLCASLLTAHWLMRRFGLGMWIMAVLGALGFLTSIQTARSCIRSLRKEADRTDASHPPASFNDHT